MRHRADPSPGLRQPPQSSHCCRNWRDCGTAGDGNGQGAEGLQWGQHSHLPACRHCRELGGASLLSAPSIFPGLFHLLPEWVLCCGVGRLRCWHPAVCMHPQPAVPPPCKNLSRCGLWLSGLQILPLPALGQPAWLEGAWPTPVPSPRVFPGVLRPLLCREAGKAPVGQLAMGQGLRGCWRAGLPGSECSGIRELILGLSQG